MYTYAKSHEIKNNQLISLICKAKKHESMNIYLLLNRPPANFLPQLPKFVGIWLPITLCLTACLLCLIKYIQIRAKRNKLTLLHGNPNFIFVLYWTWYHSKSSEIVLSNRYKNLKDHETNKKYSNAFNGKNFQLFTVPRKQPSRRVNFAKKNVFKFLIN